MKAFRNGGYCNRGCANGKDRDCGEIGKGIADYFFSGHSVAMILQANLILRAELLELFTGKVIFIYKPFFYIGMTYC